MSARDTRTRCDPKTYGIESSGSHGHANHTHTIHVWSNVPIHLTIHGWYGIKCHSVPHHFHPREGWWFHIPRNMRVGNTESHYKDSTWMNGNQWTHKFCLDKQTSTTNSKQLVFNPVPNSFREVVDCLRVGGWATQFDKYGQIGSFPHKSGWT